MSTAKQAINWKEDWMNFYNYCRRSAHYAYETLFIPRSISEDDKRRERILTIVLFCITCFLLILESGVISELIRDGKKYSGINSIFFSSIVIGCIWLYYLCRIGYFKLSAYIFIAIFFGLTLYGSIQYGASMPASLLSYVLVIIMASIVIGTRVGIVTAAGSILSIVLVGMIEHQNAVIHPWRLSPLKINDLIQYSVFFLLIAAISWLSNSEMEKSLHRARKSELLLKEERDNLEIVVEARTKALREAEAERMVQLYRFADFGKRSAGLFHDLLGPLGALTLTVGGLKTDTAAIANAIDATRRMQRFMDTIRRQLAAEETIGRFSPMQQAEEALHLLHYQSVHADVAISLSGDERIELVGNPFKFTQIITNLIANAIESYSGSALPEKAVAVSITAVDRECIVSVSDRGSGIDTAALPRIFDTFFTTKPSGIGLGLATVRDIVEKSFNGKVYCESTVGAGTTFTISIPLSHEQSLNTIDPGPAAR